MKKSLRTYAASWVKSPIISIPDIAVVEKGNDREAEVRRERIGVTGGACKFAGDDGVLLSAGICCGIGNRGNERIFSDVAAMAAGAINRVARCRLLAAAAREAVFCEAELFERGLVVVGGGAGRWNDFVSAGDRRIHRRSIRRIPRVKGKSVVVGVLVAAVLAGVTYLWVGSAVPPGQDSLATLTQSSLVDFENSFDKSMDGPRLILLLSPT